MKIFKPENSFDGKINFIDKNNIYVGYDLDIDCCEYPFYYFSESSEFQEDVTENEDDFNIEDYYFTLNIKEIDGYIEGGIAQLELMNDKKEKLYLYLVNHHNGYYWHEYLIKNNHSGRILTKGSI